MQRGGPSSVPRIRTSVPVTGTMAGTAIGLQMLTPSGMVSGTGTLPVAQQPCAVVRHEPVERDQLAVRPDDHAHALPLRGAGAVVGMDGRREPALIDAAACQFLPGSCTNRVVQPAADASLSLSLKIGASAQPA